MNKLFTYMLVLTLSLAFSSSFAQIRTLYIKGIITSIDDQDNVLTGYMQVGDTVRGTVKYDLSIQDNNSDATIADYYNSDAPAGMVLSTDSGLVFQTDSTNVNFLFEVLANSQGLDALTFIDYNTLFPHQLPPVDPSGHNDISWQTDRPSNHTLNNTDMPEYITVSDWQESFLSIDAVLLDGSNYFIGGMITSVDTISPDVITAVAEPANKDFQVYPNPAKDKLVINGNGSAKGNIEILNPPGQVIYQTTYDGRRTEINISSFPQGIYFLKLQDADKQVVKSFVKE